MGTTSDLPMGAQSDAGAITQQERSDEQSILCSFLFSIL